MNTTKFQMCFSECAKFRRKNLLVLCVFKLIKFIFFGWREKFLSAMKVSHVDNASEKSFIVM